MKKLPGLAWALGLGGVVPFAVLSLSLLSAGSIAGIEHATRLDMLLVYAAVIVSFVGAVHWGVAISTMTPRASWQLVWSVMPALAAWAILIVPVPVSIKLSSLAVVLAAALIEDRFLVYDQVAEGYARLRLLLTVLVGGCLLLAAVLN